MCLFFWTFFFPLLVGIDQLWSETSSGGSQEADYCLLCALFGQFLKSTKSGTLKACESLNKMFVCSCYSSPLRTHSAFGRPQTHNRKHCSEWTFPVVTLIGSAAFQTAVRTCGPSHPAKRCSFLLPHFSPPVEKVSLSSAATNVCCYLQRTCGRSVPTDTSRLRQGS